MTISIRPADGDMREEATIRQRLKQVLFRHLQKKLRANFKKLPHTCKHNRAYRVDGDASVGVCHAAKSPGRLICDSRIGGCVEWVKTKCPWWEAKKSKEQIKREFSELIESGERGRIASEYPDVIALKWVLDDSDLKAELLEVGTVIDKLPDSEFWKE